MTTPVFLAPHIPALLGVAFAALVGAAAGCIGAFRERRRGGGTFGFAAVAGPLAAAVTAAVTLATLEPHAGAVGAALARFWVALVTVPAAAAIAVVAAVLPSNGDGDRRGVLAVLLGAVVLLATSAAQGAVLGNTPPAWARATGIVLLAVPAAVAARRQGPLASGAVVALALGVGSLEVSSRGLEEVMMLTGALQNLPVELREQGIAAFQDAVAPERPYAWLARGIAVVVVAAVTRRWATSLGTAGLLVVTDLLGAPTAAHMAEAARHVPPPG